MTFAIGIDFGTTNSVVALAGANGHVESLQWPSASGPTDTFRTALMFWSEGMAPRAKLRHCAGPQALERALAGLPNQRFLQSIKTYVASPAFTEARLFGQRFAIEDLVAMFLGDLLEPHRDALRGGPPGSSPGERAHREVPAPFHLVAGRPVVFAGASAREGLALERLGKAYGKAGFAQVDFAYEPLGAAYWYARGLKRDETVLVADFGGGTSDFSVLHFECQPTLRATALAYGGCAVAGDTFDYRIIDHVVAPRLGKGSLYRSYGKRLPLPAYLHAAFAQWHQLSFLKSPETFRELRELMAASEAPEQLQRLADIIEQDLGFELYQAVGKVKALLSQQAGADFHFDAGGVRIEAQVTREDFERWIADDLAAIGGAMEDALARAGIQAHQLDAVFLTGGTSYVPALRRLFVERFGAQRIHIGNAFQSVASGLALIAADRARR